MRTNGGGGRCLGGGRVFLRGATPSNLRNWGVACKCTGFSTDRGRTFSVPLESLNPEFGHTSDLPLSFMK